MKPIAYSYAPSQVILAFVFLIVISQSGCGTGEHIENLDKNSERMANQFEQSQAHIHQLELSGERLASQFEQDQIYIRQLSEQLKVLADTATAFQKMAMTILSALTGNMTDGAMTEKPPASTPDIDDILNSTTTTAAPTTPSSGSSAAPTTP